VEVEPEVIDYGYVANGHAVVRTFVVRSTGEAPLSVREVALTFDSSRDFSLTAGPEPPLVLAPGEQAEYEVTYLQAGAAGDQGAVFVQTDADEEPRRAVRLRARQKEGPQDIHVDPPAVRFGQVGVGGEAVRRVSIMNVGGRPLEVRQVALDPAGTPEFSLPAPPARQALAAGDGMEVEVLYVPSDGGADESALVIVSDDPNEGEVRVPLQGNGAEGAVSCLRIAPNPLRFGAVRRGDSRALVAQLISCGVADLTVARLDRSRFFGLPLTDEFEITAQPNWPAVIPTGDHVQVEVTYTPGLAGPDLGYFVVHNDSPEPQAHLDLRAEGLPPRLEDVALHVQLEWNSDGCDVDLHLVRPGGQLFRPSDCYFSNPNPDWGRPNDFHDDPFLDVDNVRGFGPENINLETPSNGTYTVVIHYYRDSYDEGDGFGESVETDATVRIFVRGNLEYTETQHLDVTNRTWDVAEVDWPAGDIRPLNDLYMHSP